MHFNSHEETVWRSFLERIIQASDPDKLAVVWVDLTETLVKDNPRFPQDIQEEFLVFSIEEKKRVLTGTQFSWENFRMLREIAANEIKKVERSN
jgi:hypothetical protein